MIPRPKPDMVVVLDKYPRAFLHHNEKARQWHVFESREMQQAGRCEPISNPRKKFRISRAAWHSAAERVREGLYPRKDDHHHEKS